MTTTENQDQILETALVAFIDVLRFKEMLRKSAASESSGGSSSPQIYFEITDKLLLHAKIYFEDKLKSFSISDSIVLVMNWKEKSSADMEEFFRLLAAMQVEFCCRGFWTRGGVSFGKMFLNEQKNRVFGVPLVTAYELESTRAIFPRIIIDYSIFKALPENNSLTHYQNYGRLSETRDIRLSSKTFPCIFPDTYGGCGMPDEPLSKYEEIFIDFFAFALIVDLEPQSMLQSTISISAKMVAAAKESPTHISKYQWLRKYFEHVRCAFRWPAETSEFELKLLKVLDTF
jgi:hypothetical protein